MSATRICSSVVAVLLFCTTAGAQQKFHLKSDKTGRVYGPFEFAHSNKVTVGTYALTILMPGKPAPSATSTNRPAAAPAARPAPPRNPKAERAALVAAAPWLLVIDEDNYDLSWDGLADYLKRSVDKEQFLSQLKTVRKIFGRLIGRTAKRTQFRASMPSAPDGSYVIIQYETQFAEKKAAVETVIMMLDKDGKWRVSGYDVR